MTKFAVTMGKGNSDKGRVLEVFDRKEDAIDFADDYREKYLRKDQVLMLISGEFNEKGRWMGGEYKLYSAWTA